MISFKRIVKNYEQAYKLGIKIIEHRNFIRQVPPENLEKEFNKQEERIQKFVKLTEKADEEWKEHPYSINPYWTGYS
mgnify:CR=1 FL=1|tara:strand:- start:23043 stop:23273 length:231 start_codon:yes stop_codon:yes gene_type:complete